MDDLAYDCIIVIANALDPIYIKNTVFSSLGIPMLKETGGGGCNTGKATFHLNIDTAPRSYRDLTTIDLAQDCDKSIAYPLEFP